MPPVCLSSSPEGKLQKRGLSLGPHDTSSVGDCAWHMADKQEVGVEGMNEQTTTQKDTHSTHWLFHILDIAVW